MENVYDRKRRQGGAANISPRLSHAIIPKHTQTAVTYMCPLAGEVICLPSQACLSVKQRTLVLAAIRHDTKSECCQTAAAQLSPHMYA